MIKSKIIQSSLEYTQEHVFPGRTGANLVLESELWKLAQSPRTTLIPSECISLSLSVYLYLSYTILLCHQTHIHALVLLASSSAVQFLDLLSLCQNTPSAKRELNTYIHSPKNFYDMQTYSQFWVKTNLPCDIWWREERRGYFDLINPFEAALGLPLPSFARYFLLTTHQSVLQGSTQSLNGLISSHPGILIVLRPGQHY